MTTLQYSVALTMTLLYSAALLTDMVFYKKYNYDTVEIITDDNTVVQRGIGDALQYSTALLTDMVFYQKHNHETVEVITDDNTVVQRGIDNDTVVQCGVANRHGILSKTQPPLSGGNNR